MKLKNFFGAVLTLLGMISLIYAAVMCANSTSGTHEVKASVIFAVLGLIFFGSGIGLIRTIGEKNTPE